MSAVPVSLPTEATTVTEITPVVSSQHSPCCSSRCWNVTCTRLFCKLYKDRDDIEQMLEGIILPDNQKKHIRSRYITILENFKKRTRQYSIVFFLGHFVITVGSLFVPALLSIQNSSSSFTLTNGTVVPVYIITFIVSLLVTIFNGILTLFKIDKKYYFLNTTMEQLRSEGWQYLGLTGRYSGIQNNMVPTHENQFLYFSHQIERIKMKQVEEEFYKSEDSTTTIRSNGEKKTDLYPPSINGALTQLVTHPPPAITDAVNSIKNGNYMEAVTKLPSILDGLRIPDTPIEHDSIPASAAEAIQTPTELANVVIVPT